MNVQTKSFIPAQVTYPDSDGQPMADNTKQFRWITTLQGNLDAIFRHDPNVFVAGDLLWYPVEGDNQTRNAPDVMVVFGRPKGDRGSYQQWKEEHVAPQVTFEVLSPGNRLADLVRKFKFYEQYGVEEYYVYDPDRNELEGWIRRGEALEEIPELNGWVSPRLGIRFELTADDLHLYALDGRPFATYTELFEQREHEHQRAEQEHQRAEREHQRAERLEAQLRDLGVNPEPDS
ncbi:MAG: Uma2 family endonuclease [Pirellulaceae bacterium]